MVQIAALGAAAIALASGWWFGVQPHMSASSSGSILGQAIEAASHSSRDQ